MDLGIQKKTALVMSSSRGLGEGIAKSLASEGVHVLLSGRNKDRLCEIVAAGGQADRFVADLVNSSSVNTIQLAARELLGQIDIFIANTGGPPPGIISGVDPSSLTKQLEMMVVRIVELNQSVAEKTGQILESVRKASIYTIPVGRYGKVEGFADAAAFI